MAPKRTPDELVTPLDTTPNPDIIIFTLIAPKTPTPSGHFNNLNTATRSSWVSPDKTLDTSNRSSWVWKYFKPMTIDGTPYNVCQASIIPGGTELCLKQLTVDRKKSTTSMANHLDRKHRIYDKKSSTGAITNFLDKPGHFKPLDRNSLTSAVAQFFVGCNVPFHTIENPQLCNPAINELICGKDTIASFIRKTFRQGQQVLRDQLREVQSKISLTCDTWTSPSNDSVLGVTAHWIDLNFSLKSIILAARLVEGNHSGASLGNLLVEVLEDFNMSDKIFCITSENASNN
ncbi:hypothetical protein MJO28_009469 [Puccinia striiformis f. sp. tritici]|uniref:Uncharacterized protein n=1 Tax=Puccinia striiformis f. sp. tritici TaxID=168172 RepID=A0ACC0E9E4_9BASI|nr:hypothetical protein MJO28_009469 [Puccinia striiformis f. sp. tritici]